MAQITFNTINSNSTNTFNNNVGFFSLKNDGDVATVRFMHDTTDSFELLTTHDETVNGKYRKINCIRNPQEPFENCPLCAKGEKVSQRIFIHLVQYVQDETGRIVGLPKIWERPASYAYKLKNLIDEYGNLSNYVFKIKRNGAKGSRETSYDIMFCNPAMYDESNYPKIPDAFDNYKVLGGIVMDKNFQELLEFVNTGNFPEVKKDNNTETVREVVNHFENKYFNTIPVENTPTLPTTAKVYDEFTPNTTQTISRPVRY